MLVLRERRSPKYSTLDQTGDRTEDWEAEIFTTLPTPRLLHTYIHTYMHTYIQTWRTSRTILKKVELFINKCVRRILRIWWPETIREPAKCTISMRKWAWIGHTLRKPRKNITKQDLAWTASGKRSRGRPRDEGRDGSRGMQLKKNA